LRGLFHSNGHVTFDGEAPEITRMLKKAPTLAYQAAHRWKAVGTAACNRRQKPNWDFDGRMILIYLMPSFRQIR
jgi:hypothetical protein